MDKNTQTSPKAQVFANYSAYLADRVYAYLRSFLVKLDANLDRRLVETFLGLVIVLISYRHRNHGLLLSELDGYLLPPDHAPAGTKRLSNLLRSPNWEDGVIRQFFWQQADQRVEELKRARETVLAIWDESVLEKPAWLFQPFGRAADFCARLQLVAGAGMWNAGTSHFGNLWLTRLLKARGQNDDPKIVRAQCHQLIDTTIASASEAEKQEILQVAQAISAKAECLSQTGGHTPDGDA